MDTRGKYPSGPENSRSTPLLFFWRNLPRLVVLLILVLIGFLVAVIMVEKERLELEKAAAKALGKKPVNTVLLELKPSTMLDAINLPGVIDPWITLELMAKVGGTIEEVYVKEGDTVEKGHILARVEKDDYRIALDAATAAYKLAKADYERARIMASKNAIPVADLEGYETKMATTKAAMEDAELRLSRSEIKAPMRGVVSRLNAKVGLFLSVGDPVGQMLQLDKVKAVVGIPESDVDAVRRISEVEMQIQALGNRTVTGKKYFLAPLPETVARIYRLELAIDNTDGAILPGMFLRANVIKRIIDDAVAIPLYSVVSRNNEQFVFVEKEGVVEKRAVQLGIIQQWMVQITEGLRPGERVVVEGHRDVEHGQAVNVIQVMTDPGSVQL